MTTFRRLALRGASVFAPLALAACAFIGAPGGGLPPGTPIAQARQVFGGPSGEHALPGGGTRLEFDRGRDTYMLDFDPAGRLVTTTQVLNPTTFATIQPGMTREDVLSRIGRPAFVVPVGWQNLSVWSYRFGGLEGDCIVFQVSISNASGRVTETGPNSDPACSVGGDRS